MSWVCEMPDDLRVRPVGLVVLSGLDTTYNAVHKMVWDLFCNNRKPDRVPLSFIMLGTDHEYPKSKLKRTTYEFYIPKGILKRKWLHKHLHIVPSLVVVFFDLDWDDPHWQERLQECSSRLQILRASLERRSTKIAVVLIQRSFPLPGEDSVSNERAAAFCNQCDLLPKSLFVLPHHDHLFGYIIRLENAFYELSQSYYTTVARRVKSHKDYLNRSTHQLLFIRHQFKIAVYHELKQDIQMAHKHYKQAYAHCLETKMTETNVLEIKTAAGFINYKICAIAFHHDTPLDAISQFRKHIDFFKLKTGPVELSFEHYAWLSLQFQLFGDLFDEAIRLGLSAIQTQHPGFYYQQSAQHAITRKHLCIGSCHSLGSNKKMEEMLFSLEFYGQRPWRPSQQALEISDIQAEREGIAALQSLELQVNHSHLVIQLLQQAVTQFSKFKCPRMRWQSFVMIGDEWYSLRDYSRALQYLTRVACEYRREQWLPLLTAVLTTALRSAYLAASVEDYIIISVEMLAPSIRRSAETKTRVQLDLLNVICGNVPDPEPGCDATATETASAMWQAACTAGLPNPVTVSMHSILSFVKCEVRFGKACYDRDEQVDIFVSICCASQFSIRFNQLELVFNIEKYNGKCVTVDTGDVLAVIEEELINPEDLLLLPNQVKVFTFRLPFLLDDSGKTLKVTHVLLRVGSKMNTILDFHMDHFVSEGGDVARLSSVAHQPSTQLASKEPKLKVLFESEMSILLNEIFVINWSFVNEEEHPISALRFCYVVEQEDGGCSISSSVTGLGSVCGQLDITCAKLAPNDKISERTYLMSTDVGNVKVSCKVTYERQGEDAGLEEVSQSISLNLEVLDPFDVQTRYMTVKFEDCESVTAAEPFLLEFVLRNKSAHQLYIEEAQLALTSKYFPESENCVVPQMNHVTLSENEAASECQCLLTPDSVKNTIEPGYYRLRWRRSASLAEHLAERRFALPSLSIEYSPLYVELSLPAHATVHCPLQLLYRVYNRSGYVQEFEAMMDISESFVFSGNKQLHFRTLPYDVQEVPYTLFPLSPGKLELPQLKLSMAKHPQASDLLRKMLPSHIYVMPKEHSV